MARGTRNKRHGKADGPAAARRRTGSPITQRILFVNVLALVLLVGGLLYLEDYRETLIDAELASLNSQAELLAAALGEGAVAAAEARPRELSATIASRIVRRMVETTGSRARLFALNGDLIADSRLLMGTAGFVQIEELPPPGTEPGLLSDALALFDRLVLYLPWFKTYPPYEERPGADAADYPEAVQALTGERGAGAVRSQRRGGLILSSAAPVQHFKQVLGAVMLSKDSSDIDAAVYDVRVAILQIFAIALAVTVLLSIYLAGTIARPVKRLAAAAEKVRHSHARRDVIPEFPNRDDEISDLARALKEMTEALWLRMDAIERFAADVAHEIKNPLTSLRSAVETAARVKDPDQQRKLMSIIQEDVQRLDRLISDISDASRLDAELSRAEHEPVNITEMLGTLADVHGATAREGAPRVVVDLPGAPGGRDIMVSGIEGRLVQVFRNLIGNAASFSPPGGLIRLVARLDQGTVEITVEDDGPGIPPGQEAKIFERFYSERPESEQFGTHSGLGLSISKQIVEAHDGTIVAENRTGPDGAVNGARFVVRLPSAQGR